MRTPTVIDVWPCPNCETLYSISLADDEGEIECLGGSDDVGEAFADSCDEADHRGVPARLLHESGEVTREYVPEAIS